MLYDQHREDPPKSRRQSSRPDPLRSGWTRISQPIDAMRHAGNRRNVALRMPKVRAFATSLTATSSERPISLGLVRRSYDTTSVISPHRHVTV